MYSNQGDDDIRTLVQNNGFASRGLAKQVLPIAKDKEKQKQKIMHCQAFLHQITKIAIVPWHKFWSLPFLQRMSVGSTGGFFVKTAHNWETTSQKGFWIFKNDQMLDCKISANRDP